MPIISPFVGCIILVLNSTALFRSAKAVPPSRDDNFTFLSYNDPSDPCTYVNAHADEDGKRAANRACGLAFLALEEDNANTCRGWRQPACRLLPGFLNRQCSCIIAVCDQSGVSSDETRSFRSCAMDHRTSRYFPGRVAPPPELQGQFRRVESSPIGAQPSQSALNAGGLGGIGTSFSPNSIYGGCIPAGVPSRYGAGTSKGHRGGIGGKIFTCPVCDHVYTSTIALNNHKKSHLEDLACHICKKRFLSKSSFSRHIRESHKGNEAEASRQDLNEEPFEKPLEPLGLSNASKPHVCSVCEARYAWERSLRSHMKSHDPHSTTCTFCNKFFSTPANCRAHIKAKHIKKYP